MIAIIRRAFGADTNAGGGHIDAPARVMEHEAAKKENEFPGTEAEAAGLKEQSSEGPLKQGQTADSQHQSDE